MMLIFTIPVFDEVRFETRRTRSIDLPSGRTAPPHCGRAARSPPHTYVPSSAPHNLSGFGPPSAIALPSVDLFFPHVLGRRACLRDRARVCVRARAARVPACVCVFARVLYIHIRLCRCLVRPACSTSERALHLASLVISRPFAWLACPPGLFACRGAVRSPRTAPFVAGGRKRLWYSSEYRMHPTALEPLWLSRARWGA